MEPKPDAPAPAQENLEALIRQLVEVVKRQTREIVKLRAAIELAIGGEGLGESEDE